MAVTVALAVPLSAKAGPSQTSTTGTRNRTAAAAPAPKRPQIVYFITNREVTGSHIPEVICRYEGRDYTMSSFTNIAGYSHRSIETTGALNVGEALRTLDPAISSVR